MALNDFLDKKFYYQEQKDEPDNLGGIHRELYDGYKFSGGLISDSQKEETIAEAPHTVADFKLITSQDIKLKYHDIIRDSNKQYYRVTSNADDAVIPEKSHVKYSRVKIEKWKKTP
jgi:hypothetical protein